MDRNWKKRLLVSLMAVTMLFNNAPISGLTVRASANEGVTESSEGIEAAEKQSEAEKPPITYYTVTYKDGAGGDVFDDDVHSDLEEGTSTPEFSGSTDRDGYEFDGWDETIDPVTGDKTYIAKYVRNIPVEKVWEDDYDQYGIRPDSITVSLLANGEVVRTITLTDENEWEYTFGELPEYEGDIDLSQYDTIFIGGPVWWGTYPQVMFTFFKKHANDLNGKTVIPFTTHEGSGLAGCVQDVKKAFPGASVTKGFSIYGHEVRTGKAKVEKWLKSL